MEDNFQAIEGFQGNVIKYKSRLPRALPDYEVNLKKSIERDEMSETVRISSY